MASEALIKELLQQQQKFASSLLDQQKQWMQSLQQSIFNESASRPGDSVVVPPFHSFNKEEQNWESYLEQLSQHFVAYSVADLDKQKSFFLSWIGTELFELLKNLFGAETLHAQTYQQLTAKLTEHFQSKRHIVAARYEFFKREMRHSQSHREWVAELRGIARECKFNCTAAGCTANFIDEMIRDQIIVRTPYDQVRAASLQKVQPTLEDVLLIAEMFEATLKTVATIKENVSAPHAQINAVHTHKNSKKRSEQQKNERKVIENETKQTILRSCNGCGHSHSREHCKFRNVICHKCAKKGHIASVCMSKKHKAYNTQNYERKLDQRKVKQGHQIDNLDFALSVTQGTENKMFIDLEILNKTVRFQMDSGATISIINLKTYELLKRPKLSKCEKKLYAFGKKQIPILGELYVTAKHKETIKRITLIVANVENSNNLFGLDSFKPFGFEIIQTANHIEVCRHKNEIEKLCDKYKEVFDDPNMGAIKNFKASVRMKSTAVPKFFKGRQIPFAQLPKFQDEVNRLISAGVWKPVKFSNWASPIVLATKADGSVRICGDFKMAVNSQLEIEQYPLPLRETLLHKIRHGTHFTKIDLKDAYLQMELDEASKEVMVVNTPLGLFQYQRLPYGIASAPAIFQRYLEQLLSGIEGCGNYLDDIIITATSIEEHVSRIEQVLKLLMENGIRCKRQKCAFLQNEIEYLGRKISANGILPDDSGVKAIKELKPPVNLPQLEAFIGKINYYCNFIPNYSQLAAPLNKLRRKNSKFVWDVEQQNAFTALKSCIINATQLAHFNEELPLTLATDASSYGIGAVLSHIDHDGTERPIAFASKTLDKHQLNYSQIEKEGLAIIFGVQKFHQYLYGRKFLLITDHKPLVNIFNPNKHLPQMTSQRIQRWAIILMAYNFDIKYRNTKAHGNADALSRLASNSDDQFDKNEVVYEITEVPTPINANIIRQYTDQDYTLRKVRYFVKTGWPEKLSPDNADIQPFFNRRFALTIYNNLLCLHTNVNRIVIPKRLQQSILKLLHDGHWGTVRMKQLARYHVWWPRIDDDIAKVTNQCEICKVGNPAPAREYLSWPEARSPWERVHIDFAGPIFESMWLICIDAYSQFPFVTQLTSTNTESTINALKSIFDIEGIPNTIVSDNGPQLTSEAFQQFCNQLGITHITTAPFHPASNGLAERFVQTFKTAVRKNINEGLTIKNAVSKYLATYRFTPNSAGKCPAELLHCRPVRTILSQLFENPTIIQSRNSGASKFQLKQPVYVRSYSRGERWIKGLITKQIGNMMFSVQTHIGTLRRHMNQIKPRSSTYCNQEPADSISIPTFTLPTAESTNQPHARMSTVADVLHGTSQQPQINHQNSTPPQPNTKTSTNHAESPYRKSLRQRKPVSRFAAPDFRK